MANKTLKQKRQEWRNNGTKENRVYERDNSKTTIISLENIVVKVIADRSLGYKEIAEKVKDVFCLGGVKEGEKFNLSQFCDSTFDLFCTKYVKNNDITEVNMRAC